MATIVVLRNKETGEKRSMYSVDAREVLKDPVWEFEKRLSRSAKMVESGVAVQSAPGGGSQAVEFHGESVLQADARRAVEPKVEDPLKNVEPAAASEKKDIPQAPRGSRGGGKQEPAKADADDK